MYGDQNPVNQLRSHGYHNKIVLCFKPNWNICRSSITVKESISTVFVFLFFFFTQCCINLLCEKGVLTDLSTTAFSKRDLKTLLKPLPHPNASAVVSNGKRYCQMKCIMVKLLILSVAWIVWRISSKYSICIASLRLMLSSGNMGIRMTAFWVWYDMQCNTSVR